MWRSADHLKLPRKFLASYYQRCSQPRHTDCLSIEAPGKKQQQQTKMTNNAHQLLDQLMHEVKKELVAKEIDNLKTEILEIVVKKEENFLQDMVQICDSIYRHMTTF